MSIRPPLLEEVIVASEPASMAEGGEVGPIQSGWKLTARSFAQNKLAVVGVGVIVFAILFCFVGPLLYHSNQLFPTPYFNRPPGGGDPLGTDNSGFDELGRIMLGGQAALEVGFFSAVIASVIGTLTGTISALIGGWVDAVIMRIVDVLLSIPILFVVLILATTITPTVISLSILIGLFSWLAPARLVRGEVLTLRTRDFVSAARVMGASRWRLSIRHLIPNALGVVIVNVTFQVADAIILLATLGFLGWGLHYPNVSWGDMLNNGTVYAEDGYWWQIYPVGLSLVMVVMAWNFVGDAARDAVEVRLQSR